MKSIEIPSLSALLRPLKRLKAPETELRTDLRHRETRRPRETQLATVGAIAWLQAPWLIAGL